MGDRRWWWRAFALCAPLYLLTAHYSKVVNDTSSAFVPAWVLVHHGNVWLEHLHRAPYWVLWAGHHLVSNRMPGVILAVVPAYALFWFAGPVAWPAAVTAAVLGAATVATMLVVLRRLAGERLAVAGTVVLAVGTSLWTISSAEIWTHTVDGLALALAALALTRQRFLLAGLAFSLGEFARPHVAVIAAVVGLWLSWRSRAAAPALRVGVGAVAGLAALVGWNTLVFGRPSLSGGYTYVSSRLAGGHAGGVGHEVVSYLVNAAGFLFSPLVGLVVYLPLAVLLVVGLAPAWRAAPEWARGLALGGLAYTLVQLKINGFTGGSGFYGYRLATELVLCAAPLALLAYRDWAQASERRRRAASALALWSVSIQATGALFYRAGDTDQTPWITSKYLEVLVLHPASLSVLALSIPACLWVLRPPHRASARGGERTFTSRSELVGGT